MDPASIKIAAQLLVALTQSKTLRRIVVTVTLVWSLIIVALVVIPMQLLTFPAGQVQMLSGASCAGDAAFTVPVVSGQRPLSVKIATWNTYRGNSTAQVVAGLRTIAVEGADVIGVQELAPESRRHRVGKAMAQLGWGMSKANNAVPIFYRRSKVSVITQDSELVFGVRRIEAGVAGTSIGPKSMQWMQLRDRTTQAVFIAANHHLVPSIDTRGRPDKSNPRRVKLAVEQLDAAGQLTDRLTKAGPVFWTADWNIDARRDALVRDARWPFVALGRHGLRSNWRMLGYPRDGTHADGGRLIDYVMSTTQSAAPIEQRRLGRYGSDHHAVLVTETKQQRLGDTAATADTATEETDDSTVQQTLPAKLIIPGSNGRSMTLQGEQITNSMIIISEGRKSSTPEYGWIVALAAALQESTVRNLHYGDRDSQGMFQQRPASGWGTVKQIRDPRLSTRAFYGVASHTHNPGLVDVGGWQQMSVTGAAQAVQRSGFPDAYAKWEPAARSIVKQLSNGIAPEFSEPDLCGTGQDRDLGDCPASGSPAEKGLTRDALLTLRCVHGRFPRITTFGGVHPDPLPDHPSGRAVDFMINNYKTTAGNAYGWQLARWVQDHRTELGVSYVIFDAKIWSVLRDREGWRDYRPGYTSTIDDSSTHRNHVHVTVYGDAGTGFQTIPKVAAGPWTMPMVAGTYVVGCDFACYPHHNGQDFEATSGTKVFAVTAGVIARSTPIRDRAGRYVSYGNLIVIKTGGTEIFNAHLQRRLVNAGDRVQAGQLIGYSGNTGHTTGPHLHFEIRIDGNPVNPVNVLRQKGVTWTDA